MLNYMKPGTIFLRCLDYKKRDTMKMIKEPDLINNERLEILDETEMNNHYIYQCSLCKKVVKI